MFFFFVQLHLRRGTKSLYENKFELYQLLRLPDKVRNEIKYMKIYKTNRESVDRNSLTNLYHHFSYNISH